MERTPSVEAPDRRSPARPWRRVAVVLASTVGITAILGFGFTRDPRDIRSSLIGRPAPDFALRTLDGSEVVRLSHLRGQVVVINFWASWCAECRVEHPDLQAAWQRYRDRGVVLVGIPFQDSPDDSRRYAAELGGDWPLLVDPGSETGLAYGVYGVPETVFVGPDGTIAGKVIGPVTFEALSRGINGLLEEG
jgi:cytochrome c biogenesis protein CcmG, thiol:disulfide interchange protein DsbE